MDLLSRTLTETEAALESGETTSAALVVAALDRIKRVNKEINAFISINPQAVQKAEEQDRKRKKGEVLGKLAGIPIALKDNFCTAGLKTTAASKILENYIPPYTATVVERLESAGAVILGKCNLDEFAMGGSNENSAFGVVRNPLNKEYVPGGSSGGSAAAVAGHMSLAAIGTDTGGSVRLPANFCGIYGVKPTYGRISRFGIIAFASSLDQAGVLARSTQDCAKILEVISGKDRRDSTSSEADVPRWSEKINTNLRQLRIGLPKEYFVEGLDPDVKKHIDNTIAALKGAGAEMVDISLPLTSYAIATYYLVATSEASSNLARYDGVRFGLRAEAKNLDELYKRTRGRGFGPEVKRRIMLGTYALSSGYYEAYYKKACQVRRLIQQDFMEAFEKCDVILSPVSATAAFKIGEKSADPLKMYLTDIFTTSANLSGLPAMSVPVGYTAQGLPTGVQLMAPHFEEQRILNVSLAIEKMMDYKMRTPYVL